MKTIIKLIGYGFIGYILIHVYIYGALIIDAILSNIAANENNPLYGKGEEVIMAWLIISTLYFIYDNTYKEQPKKGE